MTETEIDAQIERLAAKPDSEIDTADIPEARRRIGCSPSVAAYIGRSSSR